MTSGYASENFMPMSILMQVECDGKLLDLPEDIEGLLLLNINSYMGGVDLWASGAWQPGRRVPAQQSICDGKLEVSRYNRKRLIPPPSHLECPHTAEQTHGASQSEICCHKLQTHRSSPPCPLLHSRAHTMSPARILI